MRKFLSFVLPLLLFVSCNRADEGANTPNLIFDSSVLNLSDEGGFVEVGYTTKGLQKGLLPSVIENVDWIENVDSSQEGKISFNVLVNNSLQMRETKLMCKIEGMKKYSVLTVKQSGVGAEQFSIEVLNVDYSECEVKVTPINDTMPYIVMMAEKSYFIDSSIKNEDDLVEVDYYRFLSYVSGGTLEEYLGKANVLNYKSQTKRWQDLSPAKEYIIYVYGVKVEGDSYERRTPVYHIAIDNRMPERVPQSFDVDIVADGPEVSFDIEPKSWEGHYMVQIIEDTEAGYIEQGLPLGFEFEEAVAESFFYVADHLYYFEELSAEEVMAKLGYKGKVSFSKTLNADHRYMVIIYAIDSDAGNVPMMTSNAVVEYFSTGGVKPSNMTFDVEFSNIHPRSVDVRITPSTDECYTAVMMYARNMPEGTKQEQLEYVMTKYEPMELYGVYEEHIDQLQPKSDFIIAVCGYYAGKPTTDLYIYNFSTPEDGKGSNRVVSASFAAYDIDEVAAIEPYYNSMVSYADYFLSMELTTESAAPSLHFELYTKSQYDSYTHEDIRESMLEYAYTSSPDWALCSYGNEYILCALAEDENGFVGDMYVSEPIVFTREQTSDAAIFVELYKEYVTPKALIFRE